MIVGRIAVSQISPNCGHIPYLRISDDVGSIE